MQIDDDPIWPDRQYGMHAVATGEPRIVTHPDAFYASHVYVDLEPYVQWNIKLKCEGFNFAGSIKLRAANEMIATAERNGQLNEDSIIIESSSGNLGLALAIITANRGIKFVCVTDPRCNRSTLNLMRSLGAELVVVEEKDDSGGYLQTRINYVEMRRQQDSRYLWLNQYENTASWAAHYKTTAPAIANDFPSLDILFVGVGTGGTAMGCAKYFQETANAAKVIAVDAVGSVTFGGSAGPRAIPGIGASVKPTILDPSVFSDVVHVTENDSVYWCRKLASSGFLFGGSTGTVVGGAIDWLSQNDPHQRLSAVAISPDFGDRYADTIYDEDWFTDHVRALNEVV